MLPRSTLPTPPTTANAWARNAMLGCWETPFGSSLETMEIHPVQGSNGDGANVVD